MDSSENNYSVFSRTRSDIQKYGLTVILIEGTSYLPSFAYSIGLWVKYNHPEIICFGLSTQTMHTVINDAAEMVKAGQELKINQEYHNIFENNKAQFIKVDIRNMNDYFGTAIGYYNTPDFDAVQLVWTDTKDKFPWESGFDVELIHNQPLLDRNAEFKFLESKVLGIFTTRQWLEGKPILRVIHESDGNWQFLTGDQMPGDARLVALEQMTIKDSTLNQVFDLDYGEEALREFIGGPWKRGRVE